MIIESIVFGVVAITIGSLHYTKKLKEIEANLAKEEKRNSKPPREDSIIIIENAIGEQIKCPFCKNTYSDDKRFNKLPIPQICKKYFDENDPGGLRNIKFSNDTQFTISSPLIVLTSEGPMIWQCCLRCYGEWLSTPEYRKIKK